MAVAMVIESVLALVTEAGFSKNEKSTEPQGSLAGTAGGAVLVRLSPLTREILEAGGSRLATEADKISGSREPLRAKVAA